MPLDGIGSKFLTNELKAELIEKKVDRVYQPNRNTILIFFRSGREFKKLLISANPSSPRIYLTTRDFVNPKSPPGFCMMLRKYLIGARLIDIVQPEYERVFIFKFSTLNDFGEAEDRFLIAEIMGKYSNVIFLNKDKKIHDALIHVDQDMSSKREIMPARNYQLPPSQNKETIEYYLNLNQEILPFLNNENNHLTLEKAILNNVLGFSPLLSAAVVSNAKLDDRLHVTQLTKEQKQELSHSFYRIVNQILSNEISPTLYFKDQKDVKPFDFHCLELKTLPYRKRLDKFSLTMDVFYSLQDEIKEFNQEARQIDRIINQNIQHVQKKMDWHQKDFSEGQKADYYQKIGELLNSQLYLIKDGSNEAKIIDYFDPTQKEIRIPIKSHLNPADNAAMYFKKYRKAKSKLQVSTKFLKADQLELKWLFSLKTALDKSENMDDLKAILDELSLLDENKNRKNSENSKETEKHILKNALNPGKPGKKSKKKMFEQNKKRQKKQQTSKKELPLPPREFILAEGITVYAGRNNIQNDQLTFKKADSDDLWFHAKDIPGTHVILKADDAFKIESEHIETAAAIAAWYADNNKVKSGFGGQIAVDYTLAKYVRKTKGARPGMVIYDHQKTCFVKPALPLKNKIEN